jgi:eukaryotic-like serine/threonine-protein kinase
VIRFQVPVILSGTVPHVERRVKGTLFVDYVRMIRSAKTVDWSAHLQPEDLSYVVQRVDPDSWYPMESFERMGLAILAEIAGGDLQNVRAFGRASIDHLCLNHPDLVAPGDPRDSLMRFQVLRRTFFNYAAISINAISDEEASFAIEYGMSPAAEEAASWQTLGFFERLIEVSGARQVKAWFSSRSWNGELVTVAELRWEL